MATFFCPKLVWGFGTPPCQARDRQAKLRAGPRGNSWHRCAYVRLQKHFHRRGAAGSMRAHDHPMENKTLSNHGMPRRPSCFECQSAQPMPVTEVKLPQLARCIRQLEYERSARELISPRRASISPSAIAFK